MSVTRIVNHALIMVSFVKSQVYQIGFAAAVLCLSLAGCTTPAQREAARAVEQANQVAEQRQQDQLRALAIQYLTQADVAQCEYEAYQVSANTRGILMPYAVGAQSKEMCLRAHLAARIAGQ